LKRGQGGWVRARAGLVHGVQEEGQSLGADTGAQGFWSSAFEWGKGRKRIILGRQHSGEQSLQAVDVKVGSGLWYLNAGSAMTDQTVSSTALLPQTLTALSHCCAPCLRAGTRTGTTEKC